MAVVYKCKQCGGDVETNSNGLVGRCLYCGTVQTLPKEDDEQVKQLLVRANDFRLSADFDRAIYTYEKVLEIKENEPEAHWGLLLSKYGVEYVRDNRSFQYKPTLHRISSVSIFDDADYKATLRYASLDVQYKYKRDAQEIEDVMKELLVLSVNQDSYDIFLSYKEADDITRRRTDDSFLAHDLYNELTAKGYKVFFAPKSLGVGLFEPKIYAAMLSAKIMIVLGTKAQYFDAVWVKNEWSRYIELIEKGEDKTIIPVYKFMEASELPTKLAKYQAYDMSSISFLPTLLGLIEKNNIKKIEIKNEQGSREVRFMERANIALKNGNFDEARKHFDSVLDENPKNAYAYCGKLMCDIGIRKLQDIVDAKNLLSEYDNYRNAFQFADSQLRATLISFEEKVKERKKEEKYIELKKSLSQVKTSKEITLKEIEIRGKKYKDSEKLADKIHGLNETIKKAEKSKDDLHAEIRGLNERIIEVQNKKFKPVFMIIVIVMCFLAGITELFNGYGLGETLFTGIPIVIFLGAMGYGVDRILDSVATEVIDRPQIKRIREEIQNKNVAIAQQDQIIQSKINEVRQLGYTGYIQ